MLGALCTVLIGLLGVGAVLGPVAYKLKNRGKSCCGSCSQCSQQACPKAGRMEKGL